MSTEERTVLMWCRDCHRITSDIEHPADHTNLVGFIVEGDWLLDPTTGEVLEHLAQPVGPATRDFQFYVHDQSSAEWVMERLAEAEAGIAAVQSRRKVLLDNLSAMETEHQRRADWLRFRFEAELREWAAAELEGKKQRSIKTPFGTLSFRRKPARVKVVDEQEAAAYLESVYLDSAVKTTKTVLVSMLPDEFKTNATPGLEVVPEEESFTIKTGLL